MRYSFIVPRIVEILIFVSFWYISPGYGLADGKKQAPSNEVTQLFKDKKFTEVISELSKMTDKLNSESLILLGNSYSQTQNPMAAIKTYTMALSIQDKNFEAKTLIGQEYLNMNKYSEALVHLKEALDWNPKYEPAYIELIKLYTKRKNKYEIRTLYLDMIKNLGERAEFYTKLCELSYQSGLFEQATSQCRRGIILNKEEPHNYVYLAMTFKETGKMIEAMSLLKRAADNFEKSFDAQFFYALTLDDQKNFLEAQKYYKRAVAVNGEHLKAMTGYASTTVEIQKFDEGLEIYKKACKINRSSLPSIRKSIIALRGFKAMDYVRKYEELADICGLTQL